ncbi:hypothetical protein ATK36_4252 [Amycolatopsis sulphurea]|uniref:Uncharacterized protein n=1 Tax=Amycolatopsis sulphurea TaxID=76022 RepID=A0A2A9FDV7_9PSEU|nr:hypothetical protein [Amycolatopsis sulphurea]PFG49123.1 hypothetical protein ATK36_4252 [Amycolatopsis sulphurea]
MWRDRIEIILQGRGEYLGRPDATLWRSGDVHRVLMDHLVPRQNDAWGLAEHGVETLRRFLEFLDDTERLHPRSTKVTTLLKELDRAAPGFPAAMADTSRYRLAKRVWTAMRADGLSDDSDPAEIDRWAERFSTLDADGRRPVLGELLDENPEYAFARLLVHGGEVALLKPGMPADKRLIWPDAGECDCGCADRETPVPEGLPTERELGAAVAGSTLLQRLSALGAWASAQGRPVDRRGEPLRKELASVASAVGMAGAGRAARCLADVPALAVLWELALELDVLSLRRNRVCAGDRMAGIRSALGGETSPDAALDVWDDVHDVVLVSVAAVIGPELGHLSGFGEQLIPHLLGNLYTQCPQGEFADVRSLIDEVVSETTEDLPAAAADIAGMLAIPVLGHGLAALAEHGAVQVDGAGAASSASWAALEAGTPAWAADVPDGLRVRLTDLGRRLVYMRLTGVSRLVPA